MMGPVRREAKRAAPRRDAASASRARTSPKGFLPLGRPDIPPSALEDIGAVLASGQLVEGPRTAAFAAGLAETFGVREVILVNSGTSALYLALLALGIGPGDAVIVPAFSFPATANVVAWTGALPVFADIHPGTWNLDAETLEARASALAPSVLRRVKAVMPVQTFGNPVDMGPLLKLAARRGWRVIEDAACALGSALDGRACGTHGDVGCFSFHPRKILTTSEGGALVVRSPRLARAVSLLKNHGMIKKAGKIRFPAIGLNLRFSEVAAALGAAQLARLPAMLAGRARLADAYRRELPGIGCATQLAVAGGSPNWQSMVARVPVRTAAARDRVLSRLNDAGVQATLGTYFLPALPALRRAAAEAGRFAYPAAAAVFRESVSLPLFAGMGSSDIARVAAALREALGRA